eukprot:gene2044-1489_t
MDLLDQMDEARRRQDLDAYMESLSEDHQLTQFQSQMLLNELESSDHDDSSPIPGMDLIPAGVSEPQSTALPLSPARPAATSKFASSRPEYQALTLLSKEDGETVRRLMNELHQQQTENQALIFRVNHLQIQNDALFNSDQKHKLNLDQALFVIATLEQDKLLLETKLRDIAGFEQQRNGDHLMEEVRGQLLHMSNAKERRMTDTYATQEFKVQGQTKELVEVTAKLEQVQSMYHQLQQEHVELTMQHRTAQRTQEDSALLVEELQEQLQQANEDLAAMAGHNQSLETMVSNLRGGDAEGMEMNLLTHRIAVAEDAMSISSDYESRLRGLHKENKRLKHVIRRILARAAETGVLLATSTGSASMAGGGPAETAAAAVTTALQDQVDVLRTENQQLQDHVRSCRQEIDELQEMMLTQKALGRHETLLEIDARVHTAEANALAAQQQWTTLQQAHAECQRERDRWQAQCDTLQRQHDTFVLTQQSLQLERDVAQKRWQEVVQERDTAVTEYEELVRRHEALVARMSQSTIVTAALMRPVHHERESQTETVTMTPTAAQTNEPASLMVMETQTDRPSSMPIETQTETARVEAGETQTDARATPTTTTAPIETQTEDPPAEIESTPGEPIDAALVEAHETLRRAYATLVDETQTLHRVVSERTTDYDSLRVQHQEAREALATLKEQQRATQEALQTLEDTQTRLVAELATTQSQRDTATQRWQQAEAQLATVEADQAHTLTRYEETHLQWHETQSRLTETQLLLDTTQAQLVTTRTRLLDTEAALQDTEARRAMGADVATQVTLLSPETQQSLADNVRVLQHEVAVSHTRATQWETKQRDTETQWTTAQSTITTLAQRLEALQATYTQQDAHVLRHQLTHRDATIQQLRTQVQQQRKTYAEELRRVAVALRSHHRSDAVGGDAKDATFDIDGDEEHNQAIRTVFRAVEEQRDEIEELLTDELQRIRTHVATLQASYEAQLARFIDHRREKEEEEEDDDDDGGSAHEAAAAANERIRPPRVAEAKGVAVHGGGASSTTVAAVGEARLSPKGVNTDAPTSSPHEWTTVRSVVYSIPPHPVRPSSSPPRSPPLANSTTMTTATALSPPTPTTPSVAATNMTLTVEDVRATLALQKQRIREKYAKRLVVAQQQHVQETQQLREAFAHEKAWILQTVRLECQEIVAETQRLLLAKRELAAHQAQVHEIIAELSQRSLFAPPTTTASRADTSAQWGSAASSSFLSATPSLYSTSPLMQRAATAAAAANGLTHPTVSASVAMGSQPLRPFPSIPTAVPATAAAQPPPATTAAVTSPTSSTSGASFLSSIAPQQQSPSVSSSSTNNANHHGPPSTAVRHPPYVVGGSAPSSSHSTAAVVAATAAAPAAVPASGPTPRATPQRPRQPPPPSASSPLPAAHGSGSGGDGGVLYPEMLSPAVTRALVQQVYDRALSAEDDP